MIQSKEADNLNIGDILNSRTQDHNLTGLTGILKKVALVGVVVGGLVAYNMNAKAEDQTQKDTYTKTDIYINGEYKGYISTGAENE